MKTSIRKIVMAFFLLPLYACQGGIIENNQNSVIRVAYTDTTSSYILLIANEMGFFEKQGVAVDPAHYTDIADAYIDLSIGRVDAIITTTFDLIPILDDLDVQIVMITASSDGHDTIIASNEIQTITDLRGKRIGVALGTYGEYFLFQALNGAGLMAEDVTIIDISSDDVPALIPSELDAGHATGPREAGITVSAAHIIFSSSETPGLLPEVMAFRSEIVNGYPEFVRSVIVAWFEAAEYWKTNPIAGDIIIGQYTGQENTDISFEGVKLYTLQDNISAFSQDPGNDPSSIYYELKLELNFLISAGYITTPPNIQTLINSAFLSQE